MAYAAPGAEGLVDLLVLDEQVLAHVVRDHLTPFGKSLIEYSKDMAPGCPQVPWLSHC